MPSLSDKLKSLGVKVGAAEIKPKPRSGAPVDFIVNGSYVSTPRGGAFVAEQTFTADYSHGQNAPLSSFLLSSSSPLALISAWANDPRVEALPIHKFAFLDTETSGVSGGTGTLAFLVGVGKFVEDSFILRQFFLRDPSEEPAMLEALINFLAPCEALVTFNGKSFDAPLLRARYQLHKIPLPFKQYAHVDLLHLARKLWRDRLPSRTLKYLEEAVLGFARSSEEAPGYEIPFLYFDYLRTRDATPLAGVFYHNAMDVVAMAALLNHISAMLADPYNRVEHSLDFIALGKLFEELNKPDEAARLYERGIENGLNEADFETAVKRLSALQKKRGDVQQALRWWKESARKGHIYAHVELAKYYEHKERDVKSALRWAKSAQKEIERAKIPAYMRKHWLAEIHHRLNRLERKAGL